MHKNNDQLLDDMHIIPDSIHCNTASISLTNTGKLAYSADVHSLFFSMDPSCYHDGEQKTQKKVLKWEEMPLILVEERGTIGRVFRFLA